MASVRSICGGSSNLKLSKASLSYCGKPRPSVATPIFTAMPNGSNEKELMQNLNHRLANYLETVCALEKSNEHLEKQIREKLSEETGVKSDHSVQYTAISTLRNQIASATLENTRLMLEIDNTRLAADDFQVKWSNESALLRFVERDMNALQNTKENHESIVFSLKTQLESLQKELMTIQSDHKQEVAALKELLARGKLDVKVDAAQAPDLNSILSDIRLQYEDIIKRNKEEADALFQSQYESVTLQLQREDQEAQRVQVELREKRSSLQALQLDLESMNNQVNSLRQDLENTEVRYKNELDRLQSCVTQLEQEISEIVSTGQNNKLEYEALLKIKETLEAEIKEYRRLLEGEYEDNIIAPQPRQPDVRTKKIVKIVTQTLVDGKIVDESSEVEEFENAENINSL
ncbi:keratin, type I cytoskeletal 18-B-like [Spea bombifrons]|uniref:keratin, type I cytoskeletal 18-B-like n=1 Tax=Spea bombifrons TaxID=233779 RepID=UPI00234B4F2C|nr:keratin, type I cytoskeletal 18-B-like [Spea bombifrons]